MSSTSVLVVSQDVSEDDIRSVMDKHDAEVVFNPERELIKSFSLELVKSERGMAGVFLKELDVCGKFLLKLSIFLETFL